MKRIVPAMIPLLASMLLSAGQQPPAPQSAPVPEYSIEAIRYGTVPQFPLSGLIPGAPRDQQIDIAMWSG
jgi:hypothetical protein